MRFKRFKTKRRVLIEKKRRRLCFLTTTAVRALLCDTSRSRMIARQLQKNSTIYPCELGVFVRCCNGQSTLVTKIQKHLRYNPYATRTASRALSQIQRQILIWRQMIFYHSKSFYLKDPNSSPSIGWTEVSQYAFSLRFDSIRAISCVAMTLQITDSRS